MRSIRAAACIASAVLLAQGAQAAAGYAGAWFQCQPKWSAEKNYLVVDVKAGDRAWDAHWGAADSAKGEAATDAQGNLLLRGCHALGGKPAASCNPAKPPTFAVLPKALLTGTPQPRQAALQRGAWVRADQGSLEQLARDCGKLRPQAKK
jgi:hypothetical protein